MSGLPASRDHQATVEIDVDDDPMRIEKCGDVKFVATSRKSCFPSLGEGTSIDRNTRISRAIGLILLIDANTSPARGNSYLPQEEPRLPMFQGGLTPGTGWCLDLSTRGVWGVQGLAPQVPVPVLGSVDQSLGQALHSADASGRASPWGVFRLSRSSFRSGGTAHRFLRPLRRAHRRPGFRRWCPGNLPVH